MWDKIVEYFCCLGVTLRFKSLTVLYLQLVACVVSWTVHLALLFTATSGFSCDIQNVDWDYTGLKWFLVVLNFGSHGFYYYPVDLQRKSDPSNYLGNNRNCFMSPPMVHVPLIDAFILIINYNWINLLIKLITAIHKRELKSIRVYLLFFVLKLPIHLLCLVFYHSPLQIADFLVSLFYIGLVIFYYGLLNAKSNPVVPKKQEVEILP